MKSTQKINCDYIALQAALEVVVDYLERFNQIHPPTEAEVEEVALEAKQETGRKAGWKNLCLTTDVLEAVKYYNSCSVWPEA